LPVRKPLKLPASKGAGIFITGVKAMKNKRKKIYFIELSFSATQRGDDVLGKITFFRTRENGRCVGAKGYLVNAQRVARVLEAQRLFLAQLEKAKK
jgi:hypothetical protein